MVVRDDLPNSNRQKLGWRVRMSSKYIYLCGEGEMSRVEREESRPGFDGVPKGRRHERRRIWI